MPWNDQKGGWQQGGGGRGPWGQGPGGGKGGGGGIQPPNLEELMKRGRERLRGMFPNQSPSSVVVALIGGEILLMLVLNGVSFIQQQEQSVGLRFCQYFGLLQPRARFRLTQPTYV